MSKKKNYINISNSFEININTNTTMTITNIIYYYLSNINLICYMINTTNRKISSFSKKIINSLPICKIKTLILIWLHDYRNNLLQFYFVYVCAHTKQILFPHQNSKFLSTMIARCLLDIDTYDVLLVSYSNDCVLSVIKTIRAPCPRCLTNGEGH